MYLSIIIPTRNRAQYLRKALESLSVQTYCSKLFEILVVDNGSTDNTFEVCEEFKKNFNNVSYYFDARPGLHTGRHVGLKNSIGDILVFGDDDIQAFPSWIEGVAESFQDTNVALVGGKCLPKFESPPPAWVESLWTMTPWGRVLGQYSLIDLGNDLKEISPSCVYGCNFSIRKNILEGCGGFHPDGMPTELLRFRGDGETAVSAALIAANKKAIYNPKASVYHLVSSNRMTIDYLYQRAYAQGISDSFTMIRKSGRKLSLNSFKMLLIVIIRKHLTAFRNRFKESPMDGKVIKAISSGYANGFTYHQLEVIRDNKLLEWVLKENYQEVGDDFPNCS